MLYTVLIVEDELLELQALKKMVLDFSPRIGTVLQACNSDEALSLARAHMPDLILMDINIPGCSGLDVLQTLRAEGYEGEIIIVTAYSQFKYAQTALRANAADYLLKPVDGEELYLCLRKVFQQLEAFHQEKHQIARLQSRVEKMNAYLQPIAMNSLLSGTANDNLMPLLFDWPLDGSLRAVVIRFLFSDLLSDDEQKCFYFDFFSLCPTSLSLIASISPGEIVFAVNALPSISPAQLELMLWCITARMRQLSAQRGHVFRAWGSPILSRYRDFGELGRAADPAAQSEDICLSIKSIQQQLPYSAKDYRMRSSKALNYCRAGKPDKAVALFKSLLIDGELRWAGLYCALSVMQSFDARADVLSAYQTISESPAGFFPAAIDFFEGHVQLSASPTASSFVITQALSIIQNEYANPALSQSEIAEQLGLNPAYFSRLFKKEVGKTFISFLTNTRLTQAKRLLSEGMPVNDVAIACGYQTKKYFLDAFHHNLGLTVTQFLQGAQKK